MLQITCMSRSLAFNLPDAYLLCFAQCINFQFLHISFVVTPFSCHNTLKFMFAQSINFQKIFCTFCDSLVHHLVHQYTTWHYTANRCKGTLYTTWYTSTPPGTPLLSIQTHAQMQSVTDSTIVSRTPTMASVSCEPTCLEQSLMGKNPVNRVWGISKRRLSSSKP